MRHYKGAACVAAILLAAPMGAYAAPAATAASAAQTETERDLAVVRQWLADTSRWNSQHNQILVARVQHLVGLGPTAAPIQQLVLSGDKAGAEAAVARWKTEQQALLAADRTALAAIPPVPAPAVSPAVMARPDVQEGLAGPMAHLEALPARYAAFMDMTDRQAADYMATIAAGVSSQNPEQAFSLAKIELVIALLDSECAMLDATSTPGGVQRFVNEATIQSDKALAQWYRHFHDLWSQAPLTRPARAAAIHASAAEIRRDADRIVEGAAQQDQIQRTNPGLSSPAQQAFLTRYRAAFDEGAGMKREMADLLDQLADKIAQGDDEAAMALADRTGAISRRRTASQQQRDALLQQLSAPA